MAGEQLTGSRLGIVDDATTTGEPITRPVVVVGRFRVPVPVPRSVEASGKGRPWGLSAA